MVMFLVIEGFNVVFVIMYIFFEYVVKVIIWECFYKVIYIINIDFKLKFGVKEFYIYVCGLNFYVGEDGYIGIEEIYIIILVFNELREEGLKIIGFLFVDIIF